VLSLAQVLADDHVKARGMLEHHEDAERDWWTFGSPIRLNQSPSKEDNRPARLGEHSGEVLAEKLALSEARLAELTRDGAVIQYEASPGGNGRAIGRDSLALADTADV
jgi:crotonobetainyl-CoA:carnitine CoA-transferase CaiB-like acyl-CoA transferase